MVDDTRLRKTSAKMSNFSISSLEQGPHTLPRPGEQKDHAYIKRVEELKGRNGEYDWLSSQVFPSPDSLSEPQGSSPLTSLDTERGTPSISGMSVDNRHLDNEHMLDDLEEAEYASNAASGQMDGIDHSKALSSTDVSRSARFESTPSKESAQSSYTSVDPQEPSIKLEVVATPVENQHHDEKSAKSTDSSELSPAKSTTPAPAQTPAEPSSGSHKKRRMAKGAKTRFGDFRPRTSLPTDLAHEELARQSIDAALASRLNPFVLHPQEYQLLRDHICKLHVSAYLNIRNRILRLWVRNPLVTVTPEEAAGCAYSSKWLGLAEVAYEWLVRNGYINFGCVEVPNLAEVRPHGGRPNKTRKTIVVVGAGMAGLGCARQLEGLLSHYKDVWALSGEEPPRIIVLEGRRRIGGRIYSHPLKNQNPEIIPKQLRCTAEMGAHIITGFDHGNPMNILIRGQLALHYYPLKDNSTLFDINGKAVDFRRDKMVEKLFNDMLERASAYRHRVSPPTTVEGNRDLIESGRDPQGEAGPAIGTIEQSTGNVHPQDLNEKGLEKQPGGLDKLTGKAHITTAPRQKAAPAQAAESMGWKLASSVLAYKDLDLEKVVKASEHPTLGAVMDEAVKAYQYLLDLSPQDLRLLNWHFANLEYANAANLNKLSLGGWDLDIGNEFEGEHAQVVGGYTQVPLSLLHSPHKLDLRTQKIVTRIHYAPAGAATKKCKVTCDDGATLEADHVVLTAPLGVLKQQSIAFEPALPAGKRDAIDRLGFGVLNKLVLVFDAPFWDVHQDMIGLLRDTEPPGSRAQDAYAARRGRFYLFWNCVKTAGRPVLIALMAGDAALHAETLPDSEIAAEALAQLARMFHTQTIPRPTETIVSRWGADRFARGTYSYVGARARAADYDAMALRTGRLHWAGEATCGTHPATVHGAYLSGLRAAAEVLGDLLGAVAVPEPLVPAHVKAEPEPAAAAARRPAPAVGPSSAATASTAPADAESVAAAAARSARLDAIERDILGTIEARLGPRPAAPSRAGANPFLLYSRDRWAAVRAGCDAARAASGAPGRASRDAIRAALGQAWRAEPAGRAGAVPRAHGAEPRGDAAGEGGAGGAGPGVGSRGGRGEKAVGAGAAGGVERAGGARDVGGAGGVGGRGAQGEEDERVRGWGGGGGGGGGVSVGGVYRSVGGVYVCGAFRSVGADPLDVQLHLVSHTERGGWRKNYAIIDACRLVSPIKPYDSNACSSSLASPPMHSASSFPSSTSLATVKRLPSLFAPCSILRTTPLSSRAFPL